MFSDELFDDTEAGERKNASVTVSGHKFGWIQGVLVYDMVYSDI
jgi:hypothetical protein